MKLEIKHFYDVATYTLTYIVFEKNTKEAIIVDPVLNYDQAGSKITYSSIKEVIAFLKENNLDPKYILETHAHADHLSAAFDLKKTYPKIKIAISERIIEVQKTFKMMFNLKEFVADGRQFDCLLKDGDIIKLDSFDIKSIHTPGHTPACTSFLIDNLLFTGDALFMPDFGTGRCDFPLGSAKELYNSIYNKLYSLPVETRVFTGHDYQPGGRELKFEFSIGESKKYNIQLNENTQEEDFIFFRESRDKTLSAPKLLLPSIQANIAAGELPALEDNGVSYLKIPIFYS
ncbi:MAG: MBL fold metallo-hydrolase [Bacteriovoracaceae bacterium]|jgi:glyoxylase-like metal-dependent hydrolase (beta-lactamase superfamily II)|nr:MBL fold metallo-hydrolase [Bacteriovoracaceae bacterium]